MSQYVPSQETDHVSPTEVTPELGKGVPASAVASATHAINATIAKTLPKTYPKRLSVSNGIKSILIAS
jgi:hypothetical protein